MSLVLFVIVGAFLLFMMRSQRNAVKNQAALQSSITEGQEVMTTSGLYGTVTAVADDRVDIEVADGVVCTYARSAIKSILAPEIDDQLEELEADISADSPSTINLDKPTGATRHSGDAA